MLEDRTPENNKTHLQSLHIAGKESTPIAYIAITTSGTRQPKSSFIRASAPEGEGGRCRASEDHVMPMVPQYPAAQVNTGVPDAGRLISYGLVADRYVVKGAPRLSQKAQVTEHLKIMWLPSSSSFRHRSRNTRNKLEDD